MAALETETLLTSRRLRRLRALVAPIAADRASVISDERQLDVARQICDALLGQDADGGLTRAELLAHVDVEIRELADRRIGHLEALGLLATYTPKQHQQRYTLNMAGYIGLMIAERVSERGGVEELIGLLARTRLDIEAGNIDADTVARRLIELRRTFIGFANELRRRRHTDHLRELSAFVRDHDADRSTAEVATVSALVSDRLPQLSERAAALIRAAQTYTSELEAVAQKLIDEGAQSRDFSLLDPADYDQAARTATLESLATVGMTLVFDAGTVPVNPTQIVNAMATFQSRPSSRRHPPQPSPSEDPDPLGRFEAQRRDSNARVERQADLFAQGAETVELTDRLRAMPWEGTRKTLAGLLTIHQHDPARYKLELRDSVLIDQTANASYLTPVMLHKAPSGEQDLDLPAAEPVRSSLTREAA